MGESLSGVINANWRYDAYYYIYLVHI